MKVPKVLIGRPVRIVWSDPCNFDQEELPSGVEATLPAGRAFLARWEEVGVLAAIVDGVVTLVHAKVENANATQKVRYQGTLLPEDLIETVEELVVKEPARG